MDVRVDSKATINLLLQRLQELLPKTGRLETAITGFSLIRYDQPCVVNCCHHSSILALILQGKKTSVFGAKSYEYEEGQCLISGLGMPGSFKIAKASYQKPFLSLAIAIQPLILSQLLLETSPKITQKKHQYTSVAVCQADPEILDACLRLIDIATKPAQISVLAPLILREIHYRILCSPVGYFLRTVNSSQHRSAQIAKAIEFMRQNQNNQLAVEEIAKTIHMAPSTFHRHFKAITSLSPLQFHKRLRLYEARRLMFEEHLSAGAACFAVGYESQAQFTRDYRQLFGTTPKQSLKNP